ncbi:MAG: RHS repeat-associated core domain-containing protein [Bacteroidales bacterium]|nr:RHS repeat-associated core domain-containing protein [Bacteroidales bacterium]
MTPDGALLYVTDYLGSVRAVVDGKTGNLYKASEYSAFGDESQVMVSGQGSTPAHALATAALPTGLTLRDAYTGKEAQTPDFSTGYTDFGARQYSPTLHRWMTPDPLSEKYYGVSPYAFCNNNPVNFVDPDGMDWYSYQTKILDKNNQETLVTEYAWTDATSQEELDAMGVKGTYLAEAVVVFDGDYDERLSADGSLTGDGAKPANVTVYGPGGASDIQSYTGFTMSSDFATYGAVDNGSYDVSFVSPNPESKIPKTHIVNDGKAVNCLYGKNNYFPNKDAHSATQKDAIYVHRTNANGFAGYNTKTLNAVSKGCLLIDAREWERYDSQINKTPYKLIINRK